MNQLKLKVVWIALSITLLLPTFAHAAEDKPSFTDVSGTFWARDAIDSLVQLGVLKGFEDRSFKPQAPVTREQFAQILTLSFFLDLPTDKLQSFQDVSSSRWSYSAIEASKDFLTGYYPPSGKAFFDPTGKATREDVAVALVRTLGYQPDDLVDKDILSRFHDDDEISPNLRNYVALAVEKKLLTGYNDWTLKPADGVTRAEAASLVYRVIKNASGDSQASLSLNVEAPEKTSSPTFYITGDVTKGASVFINSKEAEVNQGQFRVAVQLQDEGTYTYTVTARIPGGKTQTVTRKVVFEKGAPVLEVTGVPESTDKQSVTVSWKVKDDNDYDPEVYVNDERRSYGSSLEIQLKEGVNTIKVRATNRYGRSTEVVKQVLFQAGGPALTVGELPASTNKETVTVTWTVKDGNDSSPKVYVNDKLQPYGSSTVVALKQGVNAIVVRAVNSLGKETVVAKSISFASDGPVLKVGDVPESTTKSTFRLTWTVTDSNDSSPKVYVNDEQSPYGYASFTLKSGANTFKVKAVNKLGQTAETIRTITFNPSAPVLTLGYAPEKTSSARVTLTWTVSDENDYSPKLFLNDQLIYSGGGSVSLNLKPGLNTFKLAAANSYGKTTEITYTVTLEEAALVPG